MRIHAWAGGVAVTVIFLAFLSVSMAVPSKLQQPEFVRGQRVSIPVKFFGKKIVIEGTVESVYPTQRVDRTRKSDRLAPAPVRAQFYRGPYYSPYCQWTFGCGFG